MILFSHHVSDLQVHCFKITLLQQPIYICARCLGLYPLLLILLWLYIAKINPFDGIPLIWLSLLFIPLLLDWGALKVSPYKGSPAIRLITGLMFSIPLSAFLLEHFKSPFNWPFVLMAGGIFFYFVAILSIHYILKLRLKK